MSSLEQFEAVVEKVLDTKGPLDKGRGPFYVTDIVIDGTKYTRFTKTKEDVNVSDGSKVKILVEHNGDKHIIKALEVLTKGDAKEVSVDRADKKVQPHPTVVVKPTSQPEGRELSIIRQSSLRSAVQLSPPGTDLKDVLEISEEMVSYVLNGRK